MEWSRLPDHGAVAEAIAGLQARNFNPVLVEDCEAALEKLKQLIPSGAGVVTGASTTLEEIGFIEFLKTETHPWNNWKDRILCERDPTKRLELRRTATTSDYFLGSVQAITRDGVVLACDATGSRQGAYIYGARHVIWVVGLNHLVSDLDSGFRRLREHCLPLQGAAMRRSGAPGSYIGKIVVYERERQQRRITTLLVRAVLGY